MAAFGWHGPIEIHSPGTLPDTRKVEKRTRWGGDCRRSGVWSGEWFGL